MKADNRPIEFAGPDEVFDGTGSFSPRLLLWWPVETPPSRQQRIREEGAGLRRFFSGWKKGPAGAERSGERP